MFLYPSIALLNVLLFSLNGAGNAMNPLVSGIGMADPHAHSFDGTTVYIYSTHDELASAMNSTCCTGDWRVFKSTDLIEWTVVSSLGNFPWAPPDLQTELWATVNCIFINAAPRVKLTSIYLGCCYA